MRSLLSRLSARLGVSGRELACVGGLVVTAAALRLVNLPVRGGWDSDQGTEMLALRTALATGRLPTFGPEAISVSSSFHHGALYYDLLLPAAWLGNGDPTWIVGEIALLGLLVVPIVWWIARSIGGGPAGLIAALLTSVSASLIGYSTFIWNPTLVEPGAAVAYLGAWQAIRQRQARWWLLSALGAAVAAQSHVAAAVILLPLAGAYAFDLRRSPAVRRASIAAWGLVGALAFAATYLPLIANEVTHNFADTRGMLAYFTDPTATPAPDPAVRVIFSFIRILAWPMTRWPLTDLKPAVMVGVGTAIALGVGLAWRIVAVGRRPPEQVGETGRDGPEAIERLGTRLVGAGLLLIVLTLALGLRAVSEVQELPTEQYHVVADPLVFVAAALVLGALWRPLPRPVPTAIRQASAAAAVLALVAWNVGHWPPLTSADGGWPAAQAAAARVESNAHGSALALVPLFAQKGADAYLYPLTRDGVVLDEADRAAVVVLLCDTYWLTGCGGAAEQSWQQNDPAGKGLVMVDRFAAAPDRILTVYRRGP